MTEQTLNKSNEFIRVIEIADDIIQKSETKSEKEKIYLIAFRDQVRKILIESVSLENLKSYSLKSLKDTFLVYWNESISIDTEKFWDCLEREKIAYKRKEPLRKALEKGGFRNVQEGMEACKNLEDMINSGILNSKYKQSELISLQNIVERNTTDRMQLLKNCLKSCRIPSSQYLRFGDSMAYMGNCNLFTVYFNEADVEKLYEIWKNF